MCHLLLISEEKANLEMAASNNVPPPYPTDGSTPPYPIDGAVPPYPTDGAAPPYPTDGTSPPYPTGGAPYQSAGTYPPQGNYPPQSGTYPQYPATTQPAPIVSGPVVVGGVSTKQQLVS